MVTLECAGNGRARIEPRPISQPWLTEAVGCAEWTGVPLRALLDEAGVSDDAVELVFHGLDRGVEGGVEQDYERSLHGRGGALRRRAAGVRDERRAAAAAARVPAPARDRGLVRDGARQVARRDHGGDGAVRRLPADDGLPDVRRTTGSPGEPITRIMPRSLMVPPGIPEFMTRRRFVDGPCVLEGRAWSGWAPIASVEVSVDGGESWAPASLEPPRSPRGWSRWTFPWDDPAPGEHVSASRATDGTGRVQPLETPWNIKGYANNAVERIPVTVRLTCKKRAGTSLAGHAPASERDVRVDRQRAAGERDRDAVVPVAERVAAGHRHDLDRREHRAALLGEPDPLPAPPGRAGRAERGVEQRRATGLERAADLRERDLEHAAQPASARTSGAAKTSSASQPERRRRRREPIAARRRARAARVKARSASMRGEPVGSMSISSTKRRPLTSGSFPIPSP